MGYEDYFHYAREQEERAQIERAKYLASKIFEKKGRPWDEHLKVNEQVLALLKADFKEHQIRVLFDVFKFD